MGDQGGGPAVVGDVGGDGGDLGGGLAGRALERGEQSLLIFPEGHRTRDGQIGRFMRTGLRIIFSRAARPVYCIVADGMAESRTTRDALFRFADTKINATILGPLPPPADEASIDPSAYIGPYCVIGRARVGADCALESHVVLYDNVVLEDGVVVEPHTTLGATGVAWTWDPTGTEKIIQPQIGGVRIGEQTLLGSDVTVVRGSINEVTTLGRHCLVAHGTKIGHGCNIGDLVHFANNVTIAGSVTIGDESFLSAGCIVRPRISLPRGTLVGAGAVVVKNPEQENQTLTGVPARATGSSDRRMSGVPVRPMPKSREDGT